MGNNGTCPNHNNHAVNFEQSLLRTIASKVRGRDWKNYEVVLTFDGREINHGFELREIQVRRKSAGEIGGTA